MGLSVITALEIFTNPNDLEIVIGRENGDGKYLVVITRGPGHNFKLMLDSAPFAVTLEDAVESVKGILEATVEFGMKELTNKNSFVAHVSNPGCEPIDQTKVMNPGLINQILDELRQHRVASTYKVVAVPA